MATSKEKKSKRTATAQPKSPAKAQAKPAKKVRKAAKAKASAAKATAAKAASTPQAELALGVSVTKGKQRRAKTVAKQKRIQTGGVLKSQHHAAARTKRRQGKRDSR